MAAQNPQDAYSTAVDSPSFNPYSGSTPRGPLNPQGNPLFATAPLPNPYRDLGNPTTPDAYQVTPNSGAYSPNQGGLLREPRPTVRGPVYGDYSSQRGPVYPDYFPLPATPRTALPQSGNSWYGNAGRGGPAPYPTTNPLPPTSVPPAYRPNPYPPPPAVNPRPIGPPDVPPYVPGGIPGVPPLPPPQMLPYPGYGGLGGYSPALLAEIMRYMQGSNGGRRPVIPPQPPVSGGGGVLPHGNHGLFPIGYTR